MRRRHLLYYALGVLTVVGLGAATNQVSGMASSGLGLSDTGITFPDGSVQTSAATGPPEAWPMRCYDTVINTSTIATLTCTSPLAVPGGDFGAVDGVPAGYFFLVTDVSIEPNHSSVTSTGFVFATIYRYDASDTQLEFQDFKLGSENETRTHSFHAPMYVLTAGDYLRARVSSGSTTAADIMVAGYLTNEPERLSF